MNRFKCIKTYFCIPNSNKDIIVPVTEKTKKLTDKALLPNNFEDVRIFKLFPLRFHLPLKNYIYAKCICAEVYCFINKPHYQ